MYSNAVWMLTTTGPHHLRLLLRRMEWALLLSYCRRATSNDDSVTLKNSSSDSTLNGDVTETTHRARLLGLSTFNPLGCQQYSTSAQLRRAVLPSTSADSPAVSATRTSKPPNPPRRTTSLSSSVPPTWQPSLPPPSSVEKTSEIQKLASLAKKLAASRRVPAFSSRKLQPPRFNPLSFADPNLPFRDQSHVFTAVTSSPSETKTSHRLHLTSGCLSRQTVAEKDEDDAFVSDNIRDCRRQASATVVTVCGDDETVSSSTFRANQSSAIRHHDNNNSNGVSSHNSSVTVNVATAENFTSSVGTSEVSEVEDGSAQINDSVAAVNCTDSRSDVHVFHDCPEQGISQATTPVSSSVKDRVTTSTADCGTGPLPVSARLIITSPISSRACFVENPHRRSMCKPLTLPLSGVDDVDPAGGSVLFHPATSSLRRQRDAQLPVVVVSCGDGVDSSNYGRSWYDVVRVDYGPINSGTLVTEPLGGVADQSVTGLSVGGERLSSDTRSISSQSSDRSSHMGSLRRSTLRPVTETSALNSGPDATIAVSPVLSVRPRTPSSTGHYQPITSTPSCSAAAADHILTKSFAGVAVDRVVTKGINLKRLKKSKPGVMGQSTKDADVHALIADVQPLSRRSTDSTTTSKTTFSELAAAGCLANDWRWSRENETESRPVFTSFMTNSLGRHMSLRTCNKFTEHCSAAGNIISPQLQTGAINTRICVTHSEH